MGGAAQVRCEICGEWFSSRDDLDAHTERQHQREAGGGRSSQNTGAAGTIGSSDRDVPGRSNHAG